MKIIIDAGHGIETRGKGSPYALNGVPPELYLREYQYNRWIADAVARELRYRGISVEKTYSGDHDVPLVQRVSKANQIYKMDKDSFLISIHVNAAGSGKKWMDATGWCCYTCVGQTRSDIIADYLYESAKRAFPGKRLRMDQKDGDADQEENFYILYHTNCPAVLTENFFMDSIKDVEYLLSEEGMRAVVKCHVDGIMNYIKAYNNDKKRAR